ESKSEILLFEAKLSGGAGQREFVLFQIFYPTAYLGLKVPNKSIRPFFLDIVKRRGCVDYHFMEISYKDALDLLLMTRNRSRVEQYVSLTRAN
ncbi:hypothetical protein MUP59_07185, partial [Candidatus Bathyarchaeota archaeon]|nr:hypothetical protein [Candidatus Bathyarchaeota archaeon]